MFKYSISAILTSFTSILTTLNLIKIFFTLLLIYMASGGWRFLRVFIFTTPRDAKSLIRFLRTKLLLFRLKLRNATVPIMFQELVKRQPNKVALMHNDVRWTFNELDQFSNQVANAMIELGFNPGDEVGLFMEAKPEYVGIWLGLAKVGIVCALVNTNQRLDTLVHSLTIVNCRALIYGSELSDAVKDVIQQLSSVKKMQYFCYGDFASNGITGKPLKQLISESSNETPSTISKGNFNDRLFYIYTSGTTGLPKAAIIKHCRYMWMGTAMRYMLALRNETIYTSIPLYHLAGGVLGTCQVLMHGDTMAIRNKFSASNFWTDCIKYKCTAAQYIGEICRYLLSQPIKETDKTHNLKILLGNGLRPNIWKEFCDRFNVPRIGEFYGSTEGNANIVNVDNKLGSCGFISQIWPSIYPVALIRVNEHTGEPIRNSDGLCVRCGPDEVGEFVGKIIETSPERAFDGYVNSTANEKKMVRNVFRHGDSAFLSGDLLYMDTYGYLFFRDRTGDTYRWKGENVSTTEVETILSNILNFKDNVVYGVDVPGFEGKAGMIAIEDSERQVKLKEFLDNAKKRLPPFALPVFIRLSSHIEKTSTYKLSKNIYQQEGFNPDLVKDPIYYLNIEENNYSPVDASVYKSILNGKIRL